MNTYQFVASHYPFKEMKNQNIVLLSQNEVTEKKIPVGEGAVTFETEDPTEKNILFFDTEKQKNSLEILPDNPKLYDSSYTEKKFISKLSWTYTAELARHLLAFIREHMEETNATEVELWDIWIGDTQSSSMRVVSLEEVSLDMIKEVVGKESFQTPEGLIITKE